MAGMEGSIETNAGNLKGFDILSHERACCNHSMAELMGNIRQDAGHRSRIFVNLRNDDRE